MKEFGYYSIAIIAVLLFILSIQLKKKKDILFMQSAANFCYGIHYFLLKGYSATFTSLISSIRAMFFAYYAKDQKSPPVLLLSFFIILILITSFFTFSDIFSLLPVAITLAYFISSYFKEEKIIRLTFLVCGIAWIFYNYHVGAYILIIGNAFEIISGIISLWRYKNVN